MSDNGNEGNGKRKRNRTSSENAPPKKGRHCNEKSNRIVKNVRNAGLNNSVSKGRKPEKKIRKRRKTSGLRYTVCKLIERALTNSPLFPPIYQFFTSLDSLGTPRARLVDVLRTLQLSTKVRNIHFLGHEAWKSITNITNIFAIEEDEPGLGLYLKYWPIYDRAACTVYVDNLPGGCNEEKLKRLADCYGNVCELNVPRKLARFVRAPVFDGPSTSSAAPEKLINVGSRPKSFGFVRFVEEESAEAMIRDFRINDPTLRFEDDRKPKRSFYDMYTMKLLREIRFLKSRRKRRTPLQMIRLKRLRDRLATLFQRERFCRRRKNGRRMTLRRNQINREELKKKPPTIELPTDIGSTSNNTAPINGVPPRNSTPVDNRNRKKNLELVSPRKPSKTNGRRERKPGRKDERKKRRKRKKPNRKSASFVGAGCGVRRYFERIQVLSFKKYEELKREYRELQKSQP